MSSPVGESVGPRVIPLVFASWSGGSNAVRDLQANRPSMNYPAQSSELPAELSEWPDCVGPIGLGGLIAGALAYDGSEGDGAGYRFGLVTVAVVSGAYLGLQLC